MVQSTEEQVVIDSGGKRLAGVIHHPAAMPRPRTAFVFCHPFAEEKKSSHRAYVELARALAENGCGVLRFDFFGCGDSQGDLRDATIAQWLKDIESAMRYSSEAMPGRPAGLLGLRLGATLAAMAGADDLALIEPIVNGKSHFATDLRRMLIKQMMTDGAAKMKREEVLRGLERGEVSLDFDGFEITGRLYSEIAALDMLAMKKAAKNVLIVQTSPGRKVRDEFVQVGAQYGQAGAKVMLQAVIMPPIWNLLDEVDASSLIEAVVSWATAE